MKIALLPLAFCLLTHATASFSQDEYDYRATPEAEQIADLLDDDRDGVINDRDLCPGTPSKAEIDNDGCGTYIKTSEQMKLRILFANNSTEINPVFRGQIRQMADFLRQYPSTSIELQGFASKVGNPQANMKLSKRRAENVESMIISYGISQTRIRNVGFGDHNLSEKGTDQVSHALNRKVVATVVGHKGEVKEEWTIFTKIGK
ncbi:OmpA family protein [Vibrionales bacterium C3R12]|nr:OmpA family protein [Vibrionales bacterium C3R12]